jgi:uncharacterized protein (TIGR02246 family)
MSSTVTTSPDHPIRRLYAQILTAWNRQDAPGMAVQFEKDGNLVGFDGSQADSRAAIEDHLHPIFADAPLRPTLRRCARFGCSVAMWESFARLSG